MEGNQHSDFREYIEKAEFGFVLLEIGYPEWVKDSAIAQMPAFMAERNQQNEVV